MAEHSHRRATPMSRRLPSAKMLAGSLAVLATGATIVTGVATQVPTGPTVALDAAPSVDETKDAPTSSSSVADLDDRMRAVSRSAGRQSVLDASALGNEVSASTDRVSAVKRWATEDLNLWDGPGKHSSKVDEVAAGDVLYYTGRTKLGRDEVMFERSAYWVTKGYLAKKKPKVETTASGTGGECTNGSSVDSGVNPSIVKIHEAVCARWPEITTYGTFRGDGEHAEGRAVDIMISGATGWDIADYLRANYADFGIEYLIYSQKIWSVERSSEGWRAMEDRGSTTANHYDHVHVTVY